MSELTVAVVTHNSAGLLADLVEALPAGLAGAGSWTLVVVDNDSTDDSAAVAAELAPSATIVQLGRNAGFAAGVNAALRAAPPERALLVLNPDVRLGEGCAARLLEALDLPGSGIAVPRLVDSDGALQLSLRREPTLLRTLGESLLGGRAGRRAALGEVVTDPARYGRPGPVDWAAGAVMLVSRACWEATGPWDESFFLFSEETEYALRARDRGFRVRYVPDAVAVHLRGESHRSPALWALLTANRLRLYRRRHGRLAAAAFWLALAAGEAARSPRAPALHGAALRALLSPSIAFGGSPR